MSWRAIPGFEGFYEAHPDGIVRSVDRIEASRGWDRHLVGRVLRPTLVGPERCQYLGVRLCVGGKVKRRRVSCLIAETFIGPRPTGLLVCHENGDRMNNRDTNLYYGTPAQNAADRIRHAALKM